MLMVEATYISGSLVFWNVPQSR